MPISRRASALSYAKAKQKGEICYNTKFKKGQTMQTIDYSKYENASAKELTRYYDNAMLNIKKREQEIQKYAELAKFLSSKIAKAYPAPNYKKEKYLRPHELSICAEIDKMNAENPKEAEAIRNEVLKEMYGDDYADSSARKD